MLYVILCTAPTLLKFFSIKYLPSSDWAVRAANLDVFICVLMVCLIGTISIKYWRMQNTSKGRFAVLWEAIIDLILVLSFSYSQFGFVTSSVPMLTSALFGQQVELSYVVRWDSHPSDGWMCPNQVYLQNMPSRTDTLCYMPSEAVENLERDDTIIVSGKGTQMGLFPESVRKAE